MSIRDIITERYKRKVIAYPQGAVVHDGDCALFNIERRVCSCGLHHLLLPAPKEVIDELYPKFYEEKKYEGIIAIFLMLFEEGNLYKKEKEEFVKIEMPAPLSEEEIIQVFHEAGWVDTSEGFTIKGVDPGNLCNESKDKE